MVEHHPYGLYCEHTDFLIREPINTITNAAFFISALLLWRFWRQQQQVNQQSDYSSLTLIVLLVGIGIGSTLWHATQTRWGGFLDVLFIQLFLLFYLGSYFFYAAQWQRWKIFLAVPLFIVGSFYFPQVWPLEFARSSAVYIPSLLIVSLFAVHQYSHHKKISRYLAIAAAVFTLSVTIRASEKYLCAYVPFGGHFMWHFLNAIVLYYAGKAHIVLPKKFVGK